MRDDFSFDYPQAREIVNTQNYANLFYVRKSRTYCFSLELKGNEISIIYIYQFVLCRILTPTRLCMFVSIQEMVKLRDVVFI